MRRNGFRARAPLGPCLLDHWLENISLIELLLTYLQDIVKLPLLLLLSLLSKLLYLNPRKPSLVLMTDLARAGRELTMDVREVPRD